MLAKTLGRIQPQYYQLQYKGRFFLRRRTNESRGRSQKSVGRPSFLTPSHYATGKLSARGGDLCFFASHQPLFKFHTPEDCRAQQQADGKFEWR